MYAHKTGNRLKKKTLINGDQNNEIPFISSQRKLGDRQKHILNTTFYISLIKYKY